MAENTEIKEVKKKKRKLKWYIKLIIYILIIIAYARFIEPSFLITKEYKITSNKISNENHGLTILQFSDLHFKSNTSENFLKRLVNKINENKPDIVIFSGDLIDENYKITKDDKKILIKYLTKIKTNLDKYYILGEEDNEISSNILDKANFINMQKEEQLVYVNSNSPIALISKKSHNSYIETNKENNLFSLLVLHNPNDINNIKYNYDFIIAGHTHNGNINIPKLKELYINSSYLKDKQKVNNSYLYINSGIGTSKINMRLFNYPTINLYRIQKSI